MTVVAHPEMTNRTEMDVVLPHGVRMTLVRIEPGCILVNNNSRGQTLTTTPKCVEVEYPYWLGQTEVTEQQCEAIWGGGNNVTNSKKAVGGLSYADMCVLLTKLNEMCIRQHGRTLAFRFPTDAEWSYACVAGSSNGWGFASRELMEVAWCEEEMTGGGTNRHAVAQKKANRWGLFDMLGNLFEVTTARPMGVKEIEIESGGFEKKDPAEVKCRGGSSQSRMKDSVWDSYIDIDVSCGYDMLGLRVCAIELVPSLSEQTNAMGKAGGRVIHLEPAGKGSSPTNSE